MVTLARLEKEKKAILATQPAKKANKVSATIGRIKSIILPALGDRGVANVTEDDLERFRQSHTVNGRKPKQGTISHLNSRMEGNTARCRQARLMCPRVTRSGRSFPRKALPKATVARPSPSKKCERSAPT